MEPNASKMADGSYRGGNAGMTAGNVKPKLGRLFLFWDYDTQWGADRSRAPGGKKAWGSLEFSNTERLLEVLDRYCVKCCFAVVGAAALNGQRPYHDPAQVRAIHAAGHEVASHSHRHEWLPALNVAALRETLQASKHALEDCIGGPVVSFVPPFNQPFDYMRGGAISVSERRQVQRNRTGLAQLCDVLEETGYGFCRVAYRSLLQQIWERMTGTPMNTLSRMRRIGGVNCLRLNTPGGFGSETLGTVNWAARNGGDVVCYGHPHSLTAGSSQDWQHFVPFLDKVTQLRDGGALSIARPREVITTP